MPTTTINLTGQALSKVDDTNVTLTLTGTPLTALLKATTITVGWTGTLADARIASAATWNAKENALTFSTGLTRTVNTITIDSTVVTLTGAQALSNKTGLISQWTNDSGYLTSAVTSVTGSGNIASSGGATPNITFTGTLPIANGGTNLSTLGTANQQLRVNAGATGLEYFTPASGGITINSTAITGGGANRILFENSSNQVSEDATSFYFQTATPFAHVFAAGRTGTITGAGNTLFGYNAGKSLTTQGSNTYIGYICGTSITGTRNVGVGWSVLAVAGSGTDNAAIGADAMTNSTSSSSCVAIGSYSLTNNSGSNNTGCGRSTLGSASGSYRTALGSFAGFNSLAAAASTIEIGYNASVNASNTGCLGSNDANGYISNWYFNGVTHTAPYSVVLHACHGSGTNVAAANFTLSGGAATGTAAGGYVKTTTSVKRASGTTQQSDTDRNVIVGKYVDITESAATTFGTLALTTSGTIAGGTIIYTIEANDGTDYQSLTGNAVYSVVNKAGTLTVTFTDLTQALAESAGGSTLTSTMTATVSGTSVLFQANAVSSLTQTTLRISFQVLNNFGVAIVTPA